MLCPEFSIYCVLKNEPSEQIVNQE
jgi:hypothetical protein